MPKIKIRNIFSRLSSAKKKEVFQALKKRKGFKIERIVSWGQATAEGKWLHPKAAEWVIVLQGKARLRFKGAREALSLKAGDYVFIPGHACHRVEWTSPVRKTVWLAIHETCSSRRKSKDVVLRSRFGRKEIKR